MKLRSTYTYVTLDVSQSTFDEIEGRLRAAGYTHAFHQDREDGLTIDMHGLALVRAEKAREI